jgi:stearoyl-CoA desaturase (Delta-9 desaturase)
MNLISLEAGGMSDPVRAVIPPYQAVNGWPTELAPIVGAPFAIGLACLYGLPVHAVVSFVVVGLATGLGITAGFHRLFTHRSFTTPRLVECILMTLGCMSGQSSPFFWIATHRTHHLHSDQDGDPHSPYIWDRRSLGLLRGFWHAHFGWLHKYPYTYAPSIVKDLTRRRDLAWIDCHWFPLYLSGLAIPAIAGAIVGGTAYDALMGLLWGGLLRHFLALQATFAVNSVTHIWGRRPYETTDQSRNNLLIGVLAFGEGWHNNHHAFPYSARHGLHWWQPDATWCFIWLMERIGLAWCVKRPIFAAAPRDEVSLREHTAAHAPATGPRRPL